jgi:cyclopropane-fatty-acyl-phospholipid synthase
MDAPTRTAVRLLTRVFQAIDVPLAFRLWDGTPAPVGPPGESSFAVVFRSPRVLRRLLLRPTSLRFGEAYLDGEIDIEGDLFAAMTAASSIEELRVPIGARLAVLAGLLRL